MSGFSISRRKANEIDVKIGLLDFHEGFKPSDLQVLPSNSSTVGLKQ